MPICCLVKELILPNNFLLEFQIGILNVEFLKFLNFSIDKLTFYFTCISLTVAAYVTSFAGIGGYFRTGRGGYWAGWVVGGTERVPSFPLNLE